jgi:eukaryotic-like serine/threonine-protein kinase
VTEPQDTGAGDGGGGRVGLVGRTLGRYRISAELGRGGMATVYRAFDPQLQRDVAVKVIHGAFTGRGDIERRFRREAQAVAALKHESIVDIFDFAPGGDGEPAYIVSELVEGPTLRQLVERAGGRLVPELAAVIGARVAAALGAAHARGIIHRDVKPDNVMIDLGAGGVRIKLTDFGIARMTEDDTMTATGSILGSPSYMSPEQAKSGTITPASDVFSLGVTLYQLATGRMPFPGKDPLTVIAALIAGEFLRPTQVDAHVAPELEALILRCLKRAPEERFVDGNAAATALRALVAASAAVVGDESAALRAFHESPTAFARTVGGPIADEAVTRARAAIARGDMSKALGQINRALAYVPDHRGAEALLATISARRRWVKAGAIVASLVVAAGAFAGLRAVRRRGAAKTEAASVAIPVPSGPDSPAATAVAPAVAPAVAAKVAPPRREPPAPRKRPRHATADLAPASPPVRTPEPEAAPAVAPPPTAVAVAVPPPAPTAGITLRARQGFCSPSLDDRAPALRPIYAGVSVGPHEVFCTLPGGTRERAGTYELHAGTHPDLVIVPGPDGHPMLSRPQ